MLLQNKYSYPSICYDLLTRLSDQLPGYLSYHCLDHTIDVANTSHLYIEHYKIDKQEADLIKIAAVAHDLGYIESPKEHEEKSIAILSEIISDYDYSQEQVDLINGMIRATKIPQKPENLLEQIIADSDLDYLGRNDYDDWSDRLYHEFLHFEIISNEIEWLDAQINFLKNHKFHTQWAIDHRVHNKCERLEELKVKRAHTS